MFFDKNLNIFFSESINDYNELVERQTEMESWNMYLACDKLPNVHHPPEMRSFIEEMRLNETKDINKDANWVLSVNERSILTQDLTAVNLTRRELEKILKPDIGKFYDDSIQRILIVLDRIEVMLASDIQMVDVSPERAMEIIVVYEGGYLQRVKDIKLNLPDR